MKQLDIHAILEYLPHRYPFLLVDRVLDYTPGESLTALKNVTQNEPFFQGHFPEQPVMPGVMMLEALAQAAGILIFLTSNTKPSKEKEGLFYFAGIDNARFKKVVEPGDQLTLRIDIVRNRRELWKFSAKALVGEELACSAELIIAR
ncbi:MAG: 3-hydroxyacyl-ACP dehydratase FabZ [Gammaproteobacteria bacterium]|nr:3-hydroxyacyl-ACP dehydratase FabZ [Gammaproteobacteria bacterium]